MKYKKLLISFLFPQSSYLANYWWHRLAKVIFWVWFIFVILTSYYYFLQLPWAQCLEMNLQECRRPINPFEYALEGYVGNYLRYGILETSLVTIWICFWLYVSFAIPSLVYRLLLYIAKGNTWKG
jgi:hypothetical protein